MPSKALSHSRIPQWSVVVFLLLNIYHIVKIITVGGRVSCLYCLYCWRGREYSWGMLQGERYFVRNVCVLVCAFVLCISFYLAEITLALGHLHKEGIIYR